LNKKKSDPIIIEKKEKEEFSDSPSPYSKEEFNNDVEDLDDEYIDMEHEIDIVTSTPPETRFSKSPRSIEEDEVSSSGCDSNESNWKYNDMRINVSDRNYKNFINYPSYSINNCELCISVFMSYTLPLFPSFVYNYDGERTKYNWNILLYDLNKVPSLIFKIDQWLTLAKDCVAFACGSRMLSHLDLAMHFILELESILIYIFRNFSILAVHIDSLINMWIIKTFFYLAIEDKANLSNSILSLYKLSTTYSDYILPSTKHKILSIMILLPENDCFTWLDHISTLGEKACSDIPNLILLTYVLNLRAMNWNGSWDDVSFVQNEKLKSLYSQINQFSEQIDKLMVKKKENFPTDLQNFFESVVCINKATVNTLDGNHQESLSWASKSFNICKKLNFPYHCLINSISPIISIYKSLSQTDLENETRTFKLHLIKKHNLNEETIQHPSIGHPNPMNQSNGDIIFPFMKIEHCISNDYGVDLSDLMIFESDETVNTCKVHYI